MPEAAQAPQISQELESKVNQILGLLSVDELAQARGWLETVSTFEEVASMSEDTQEEKLAKDAAMKKLREKSERDVRILEGRLRALSGERREEVLAQPITEAELTRIRDMRFTQEEIDKAKATFQAFGTKAQEFYTQAKEQEDIARQYKIPELYLALQDIRKQDLDELNKITTDDATELMGAFEDAVHERHIIRASAILRKLVNQGDENEILDWYGYDSNLQGFHDFTNEVLIGRKQRRDPQGQRMYDAQGKPVFDKIDRIPGDPKLHPLGMSVPMALALEKDISYAAERIAGHWELGRAVMKVMGEEVQMTEEQHVGAAIAEFSKMRDARAIARQFNRLAHGGERIRSTARTLPERVAEYRRTFERDFIPSRLGVAILLRFARVLTEATLRIPPETNQDLIQRYAGFLQRDPKNKKRLERIGVNTKLLDAFLDNSARGGGPDIGALVERTSVWA